MHAGCWQAIREKILTRLLPSVGTGVPRISTACFSCEKSAHPPNSGKELCFNSIVASAQLITGYDKFQRIFIFQTIALTYVKILSFF